MSTKGSWHTFPVQAREGTLHKVRRLDHLTGEHEYRQMLDGYDVMYPDAQVASDVAASLNESQRRIPASLAWRRA